MGIVGLATAAGAGQGLETLLARMREEEMLKQRGLATDAGVRNINSEIATRDSTTQRANATSDSINSERQVKIDALKRITHAMGENPDEPQGLGVGTPVPMSLPGQPQPPTPSLAPREMSGLSRLNNPEGRTLFQVAGINPNESFGSVPTPAKPKGPEDLSAEESFYTGRAKKAGFTDYKTWAAADPDGIAKARHAWAEQSFSPIQNSPPVVQVGDPDTGRTVYASREDSIGKPGPLPAGEKDRIAAYNATLDLIDEIERLGDKTKWEGIGPIEGPLASAGKKYFGVGSDESEALRNKLNQLKAAASFQEGGKQFTGTEKALLDAFLANVNQNPSAVRDRLRSFRESATRSLNSLGATRQGGGTTPKPGGGGGGDMYDEYLRRTKPGGGGEL